MLLQTMRHQEGAGWSAPWPFDLDSGRTLAVMFGGGTTAAARNAVAEVAAHLPRAVLLGCSSAGEICADRVQDGGLTVAIVRFDSVTLRKAALPAGTGLVGCYSYGEMSPAGPGGGCDLYNQTMTVTLLDEWPATT